MEEKINPFPANGDASKIARFTDFLICLRENRKEQLSKILIPLLDRANLGESRGIHDAVVVGEIGRGKTHLLKFLEKKLLKKPVKLVSDSLSIPAYNNIMPIYVKFDVSMIMKPEFFVYYFLNFLLGTGVKGFGLLNSPLLQESGVQLEQLIKELYRSRFGQDIEKPQAITAQHAIDMLDEVCREVLRITKKKSILLLLDELEGIILASQKQKEQSLNLVLDFFRQFHTSINQEEAAQQQNIYAVYAMTAPAFDAAQQARQESGAFLSRLRSHIIEIPLFSIEELTALASTALGNENLLDVSPFSPDALAFVYRSVMGQPRYTIEALHNGFELLKKGNITQIGPKEVFVSTSWLNPTIIIDKEKVAKLKGELGTRYSYLIDAFVEGIQKAAIPIETIFERAKTSLSGEVKIEQVYEDLEHFHPNYVVFSDDNEEIKVMQAFYNRILKQFEKEPERRAIDPEQIIKGSSETAAIQIKTGIIPRDQKLLRLSEALNKVLKQLFEQEGITSKPLEDGWTLFETRKSLKGDPIRLLATTLVEPKINQAELVTHLEQTKANAVLFLHDLDDKLEEEELRRKIRNMQLPESYPWVKKIFADCFDETTEHWSSKKIVDAVTTQTFLSEICIDRPVSRGTRFFTSKGAASKRIQIDERGLWYSITEMARAYDVEMAQSLEQTLKYVILDFFGELRRHIIDKISKKEENIKSLLSYEKKLRDNLKDLMEYPKSRDLILNQQIIDSRDLPRKINNPIMNRLCNTGLFFRRSMTSWQANSINDAQQYNPWVRLIAYNSAKGKGSMEIISAIRNLKIGISEIEVINCIKFYFELYEIAELVKDGRVKFTDNKSKLLQAITKEKTRIEHLKQKQFAGYEKSLSNFSKRLSQIHEETKLVEKEQKTILEKDVKYKANLTKISELSSEIDEKLAELEEKVSSKNSELDELLETARTTHSSSLQMYNNLNLDNKDSAIFKLLLKKPHIKPYVLEIPIKLIPPRKIHSLEEKKKELEKSFRDEFLTRFLSEAEDLKTKIGQSIEDQRIIESKIKTVIEKYVVDINRGYRELVEIKGDFSPGTSPKINELVTDTQVNLARKDFVKAWGSASEAKFLLVGYVKKFLEKATSVRETIKSQLQEELESQNSYLNNSIKISEKRSTDSDKVNYGDLLQRSENISQDIRGLNNIKPTKIDEKTTREIIDQVMGLIEKINKKKGEIKSDLEGLNKEILKRNKSTLRESLVMVLRFLSKHGKIDSLNYSEFVKYMGDKTKAEEAIIEIVEIGLASLIGVMK